MAFTSVVSSIAQLTNSLRRVYRDEVMDLVTNTNTPMYEMAKAAKNVTPDGEGVFWGAPLASPQNMGSPAESGAVPPFKPRTEIQLRVRPVQFINTFSISFILAAVGNERGGIGGMPEVKRHIKEALVDLTKHMQRIFAGTHGSGRLGQVNANNGGATTFVMKAPYTLNPLRKNMLIDVYTADSAGSLSSSGAATQLKITDLTPSTQTVTVDTSVTILANEHIYVYPDYNNTANGLLGLVDDSTFLTTVHNQSRSTYSELKCSVNSNSGTLRPLTENHLVDLAANIKQASGKEMDTIILNSGQLRQYFSFVAAQRRYAQSGKGTPAYNTGFKESDLQFFASDKPMEIKCMEDVLPRAVFMIQKGLLNRFESEKIGWVDQGGGSVLTQGVSSGGFLTTSQATLKTITNIGYQQLNACGTIRDLLDPQLVGDPEA